MYQIKLISIHKNLLEIYSSYLINFLRGKEVSITLSGQPVKSKKLTLFRSPHVNKKSKEQFIVYEYKKIIYCSSFFFNSSIKKLFLNKPNSLFIKIKSYQEG